MSTERLQSEDWCWAGFHAHVHASAAQSFPCLHLRNVWKTRSHACVVKKQEKVGSGGRVCFQWAFFEQEED